MWKKRLKTIYKTLLALKRGKKKQYIQIILDKMYGMMYGAFKQASEIEIVLTILYKKESKTTPKEQ